MGDTYKGKIPELVGDEVQEYTDLVHKKLENQVRRFETGAVRDTDNGKFDYEGFLSPLVERSFAAFMHKHRTQTDGNLRDSDNWQKGIPKTEYMKSMFRHFIDAWSIHRGMAVSDNNGPVTMEDALNGIKFNVNGYIHELLKAQTHEEKESMDLVELFRRVS